MDDCELLLLLLLLSEFESDSDSESESESDPELELELDSSSLEEHGEEEVEEEVEEAEEQAVAAYLLLIDSVIVTFIALSVELVARWILSHLSEHRLGRRPNSRPIEDQSMRSWVIAFLFRL